MALRVKLREIIDALELPDENWASYLNRETGQIVTVTDEDLARAEDAEDLDGLEDWEREAAVAAQDVLDSEQYLPLPDKFEIHEWAIMERFAIHQTDSQRSHALVEALHGRGAFRRFKGAIRQLGIEAEWYRFRESALEAIAREWLEANGIEYE